MFPDWVRGRAVTILFATTTRFCDIKQRRNCSFLTSSSIAITSVTVRSSGVLLETGHVFLMRFIVGVKSYMEVSSETSDMDRLTYKMQSMCITHVNLIHLTNPLCFKNQCQYSRHQWSCRTSATKCISAQTKCGDGTLINGRGENIGYHIGSMQHSTHELTTRRSL